MKKNTFIIISIVAIVGLIGFMLYNNKKTIDEKSKPKDHSKDKVTVTVARVASGSTSNTLIKTGTLIPFDEADIIASAQGKVTGIFFELGSHLGRGSRVANINQSNRAIALADAQITVKKLENDYQTYQELLAGDGTTRTKVKDIKLSLDNARHQVQQIQQQITDYSVLSPINGIVVAKNTVTGEFVGPGTVLGKVVDITRLKVQINVSEEEVYKMQTGQYVKITSDVYPAQIFDGKITFISPQGDSSHNYPVEVTIANSSQFPLKAGTFAFADFSQPTDEKALQIPRDALIQSIKNPSVYVYLDGKVNVRAIQIGRILGDKVEIKAGLSEGEIVVVNGQINLSNGVMVEVIK